MALRCQEIDPKIYELMNWTHNCTAKLYYAIYAYLKKLGLILSFTKYREAVTAFAGINLKRNFAHSTEKLLKSMSKAESEK
jgi:hypothetical protein